MSSWTITRAHPGYLAAALSCLLLSAFARTASAQNNADPDLRNIEPFVMIIVDSSGSMERLPDCVCEDTSCVNCLPKCGLPATPQTTNILTRKNRWGFTIEALTGQFIDFQCNALGRTQANGATYDLGYPIDYHQPWKCPGGATNCAYPGTVATPIQLNNGVLDTYSSSLRFGLMTFDGMDTYQGANPLIPANQFNETLSESQAGMWSYGGPQSFHYPNCLTDYAMDTGARSSIATEGGMVTVNSPACPSPPCSIYQVNDSIQSALLRTRPFGGTPIAASLHDLYYHLDTDIDDALGGCRKRYALLITDGYPDKDYRDYDCDCNIKGNCPPDEDPDAMKCPYPEPEDVATRLVEGYLEDPPQIKQLFVIGVSIETPEVQLKLDRIASNGGSPLQPDMHSARFAANFEDLTVSLDQLFGGLTDPVTRSVPSFATGAGPNYTQYRITSGFRKALGAVQNGIAPPWTGIIERQRFGCTDSVPTGLPINTSTATNNSDKFHQVLNGQLFRRLITPLPASPTRAMLNGLIDRNRPGAKCPSTDNAGHCVMRELNDTTSPGAQITPTLLGFPDDLATTERTQIFDWMYGAANSVRFNKRLGDIYHSSPTIMRHGTQDASDSSYTSFRERQEVANKPLAMYVGSNDGILHAFSVEDYTATATNNLINDGKHYNAGEEMWGFVPPILIDNLEAQLHNHQFGMDATPYIKDAFFYRPATGTQAAADGYRTVLITGMRAGGNAYQALDISDPIQPKFLWQFTDVDMGLTYGKPVIAQLEVDYTDSVTAVHYVGVRAVAILPGGVGTKPKITDPAPPGCSTVNYTTPSYRGASNAPYSTLRSTTAQTTLHTHRDAVPCWNKTGRVLFFVDLETGREIKRIQISSGSNLVFPSPLVGSPTVYPDAVGQVAKEGFVVDADGVIWRMDFSSKDPIPGSPNTGWTVRPFHDLFWGMPSTTIGETSYEVPILSVDENRRLVVLLGTGDTDNFDKPTIKNRIVSLTEVVTGSSTTKVPDDYKAAFNWEMRDVPISESERGLIQGELVTGSMALFEGRLFMSTFAPIVNNTNLCQLGRGRLWSVHYNKPDTDASHVNKDSGGSSLGTFPPQMLDLTTTEDAANSANSVADLFNTNINNAPENLMIFGLGATQLTCSQVDDEVDYSNYFQDHLQKIQQTTPPSIWVVAQTAGNQDLKQMNSVLGSINVQLDRPMSFSKVTSWASSTD